MRYLTIIIVALFWNVNLTAQTYEIGAFLGGSNFIGDVGSTNYIAPNKPVIGGIFKWNRSARHSFRFTALFSELEGDDNKSSEARRNSRGLSFKNSIKEFSLGLEYTFWEFDMFNKRNPNAPYLYTGFTYFNHEELNLSNSNLVSTGYTWDVAIPLVLGYKAAFNSNVVFALEGGIRYTLTDNLDGSAPGDGMLEFGNKNNDDWYMFTGITVSFTFGRRPCFCVF
ncbi:DUF6089 family protein [Dokdonia sp. Hel_I_53]|uniref:type IX secretion system protein PorG n=1 Tax=Dokdonia sp. Hel_I_53 TaxID=1566287 RepID=UPI00119C49CC|nr:DUF6089 family protein [Dokdonia sp. Hel_I_53]TVZ52355.1 hypothetical protein OD90_1530 [Dokdonia sp. Hel_I_53]